MNVELAAPDRRYGKLPSPERNSSSGKRHHQLLRNASSFVNQTLYL
jgi:hypothetical protein